MDKRTLLLKGLNQPYQPITQPQVSKFLREYRKNLYYGETMEQAWEDFTKGVNLEWYLRYGLNLGFTLTKNKSRIRGSWHDNGYTIRIANFDPLRCYSFDTSDSKMVRRLEDYCLRYKAKFKLSGINFKKRRFSFDDYPTPEWDWLKWRAQALQKIRGTRLNRYHVDCLINKYKRSGNMDIHPDEALKNKINEA